MLGMCIYVQANCDMCMCMVCVFVYVGSECVYIYMCVSIYCMFMRGVYVV